YLTMRKCRSCGYILLGEADTCGRCGAPLAVVTAGVAAAPASAAAAEPAAAAAAPAAPAAWPPVAAPTSAPASAPATPSWGPPPPPGGPVSVGPAGHPLPAIRESWQPVTMPTEPARQPRSTRRGLIALAVAIALVVGAGVMHFRSDPLPKGTSAFVA